MIILENHILKIEILPELGGKILSFYRKDKDFELAAQKGRGDGLTLSGAERFSDYAFGMDDAFPNIDAEEILWDDRWLRYPDHGEIWNHAFQVQEQGELFVKLGWRSEAFSYLYEKSFSLEEEKLRIRYRICNSGGEGIPCIWTWHGLMRYEEDMRFLLPEEIKHCRNVMPGSILGEAGNIYPIENSVYDFTAVPKADAPCMVKYYGEERVRSGRCGFAYPSQKLQCILEYDAKKLPYLGVWITAGGFQGDYNCALEPSSGFYDKISRAGKFNALPVLGDGEETEFEMAISLEKMDYKLNLENIKEKEIRPLGEDFKGTSAGGEEISFTNYYMMKNGKPFFGVSGEFHFSRMSDTRWEDEMIKMKMGGISVVATYLFWIHHEEEEGVFDFTGCRNLRKFVELCHKHGLYVILRVGPFDHGEVRNGGIPDWMYGKPFEVRKLSEGFLFYTKRLYAKIGEQVAGLFFKDNGPIIGVQIDNEYMHSSAPWEITMGISNEWVFGGDEGDEYMLRLKDLAAV